MQADGSVAGSLSFPSFYTIGLFFQYETKKLWHVSQICCAQPVYFLAGRQVSPQELQRVSVFF
jgi:hypothetical protein